MDEDALLARIVGAVQGARSAFQNMCDRHRIVHAPDSHDLLALDASLQALGNVVEILESIVSDGAQLVLVNSVLTAPVACTASGDQISLVETIIADMDNLKLRLSKIQQGMVDGSTSSSATIQSFAIGEVMGIRWMVEKYRSMFSSVSGGQVMYGSMFFMLQLMLIRIGSRQDHC
jgi:hypothetical protein